MNHPRRREAGLTLIEMLIAVALLGIVLLGIAPLFIASVRSNYAANEYTSIHNLARDRLEQLSNLPVTDPQLTVGTHANDLPPFLPDPTTGILPSTIVNPIQRSYTVAHYRSTGGASGTAYTLTDVGAGVPYEFKRIDVTVTSTNGGSGLGVGARTAQVTGFIRNPDPLNNIN
ncbi:MAG TPA: prepilin-type N-terminal cleavage/methylation domain-containing protein [Thermoanaerobaculia bacterium]|nr:prepilin-type N-terminal cleavage/methylation domain-containing protein [Thermoanaerobaculia bacterium]